jgi:signal transduction histidine kinase
MRSPIVEVLESLGIRTKLIILFILIKVLPLILLAVLAWEGVLHLGGGLADRTDTLTMEVGKTVEQMGQTFTREAVKALDDRAREELERLTTDTARTIADFLYDRDRDILLAAKLEPGTVQYRDFVANRSRNLTEIGKWRLADDGKSWMPADASARAQPIASPSNPENKQDFHYRQPESVQRTLSRPLYHEITFVGLDGKEKIKISQTGVLPSDLRDVSRRENTWSKAETYFGELKQLKPGQIYVSDVIGPYVPSRIIGPVTPDKAKSLGIDFSPETEAYAGRENPKGKRFQGVVRWATPVTRNGSIVGYVTLALDHTHIMSFTDNLMPTAARYTAISDATNGNYAFIWDYRDRNIAHPRHHSIVGFDAKTGENATPWLEAGLYDGWKQSSLPLRDYLKQITPFDHQSREKKPAKELTKAGQIGLDCQYLNFAPQCQGWHDLTQYGGSGSFLILWTGVWKLTTAASIPYRTGQYADTPRGFGYVTIGANVEDFHKPAQTTSALMTGKVAEFGERMKAQQNDLHNLIAESMQRTSVGLISATLLMVFLVVVIAIWLASMLTRRITDVIAGLARIESGQFGYRFNSDSKDELGKLSDSLNTMTRSVEDSFKRLDEARRQAEENSRLKSNFVASMSHELRTPLNGILGFAEMLRDDAENEETRDYADTIYQSGQHLLTLVNDVLDIAKIESGNMTLEHIPFAISPLLREMATLHTAPAQQKGLQLITEFDPALPDTLTGDPTRLRQVIHNLMSNAVKFTQQGEVQLAARREGENIVIEVRDTGPGIPFEAQAAVFERFRQADDFITRAHGGSGLGLTLAKEFMTLMGGTIRLESEPGRGSRFEISLPLVSPAAPAADSAS